MAVMTDLCCDNPECDYYEEDVMVDTNVDNYGECAVCGKGKIIRAVGQKFTFELKYNNKTDVCAWGNEGYSSSQFYKNMKKGDDLPERFRDKWY